MGNICGKADKDDHFAGAGRVVGTTPAAPSRASVPSSRVVGGPPRTLGGNDGGGAGGGGGAGAGTTPDEARRRAAEAAEARAQASTAKNSGKLGAQLAAQKKQTRQDLLNEASREERRARDADEAAQARAHH